MVDFVEALSTNAGASQASPTKPKQTGLFNKIKEGPWIKGYLNDPHETFYKSIELEFKPDPEYLKTLFGDVFKANEHNCPCGHPPFVTNVSQAFNGKVPLKIEKAAFQKLGENGLKKLEAMVYRILTYNPTITNISITKTDTWTMDSPIEGSRFNFSLRHRRKSEKKQVKTTCEIK